MTYIYRSVNYQYLIIPPGTPPSIIPVSKVQEVFYAALTRVYGNAVHVIIVVTLRENLLVE